jgi:hypothetical protein
MSEKTCCVCGCGLTNGTCLSCNHTECARCPVYVEKPRYDELEQQLKTARELLLEYRRSRFDHATCTAPNRCDLCCRTDAHLNP